MYCNSISTTQKNVIDTAYRMEYVEAMAGGDIDTVCS